MVAGERQPAAESEEPVAASAPAAPAPASFTVLASGDVLIHPALTEQALADAGTRTPDFGPLLAGVAPTVTAADLALCHLEVPLAEPGGPFAGYPNFNAPPQVATALARAGYDSCSTASNHTLDQGRDGVRRTLDAMDAAGLAHTGSARSAAEAARPLIHDLGVARVAQVSFSYGYNGLELPPDAPWLANTLDTDAVLQAARVAKRAGADLVIASLHWGAEYQSEPTEEQRRIAQTLLADPAVDLIVGHHTHVVQPFERIHGKWVAYGLGNHLARHSEPRGSTEEGVLARFTFSRAPEGRWRVSKAEYLPTLLQLGPPIRLIDLSSAPVTGPTSEALTHIDRVVGSHDATEAGLSRPGS
ncbi:MAG TPA: CapA family protein [Pseudonocardiaceae bacterium]|nr:CapA family protein [Pseudonocardiaceae bacterium]